MSADENTPTVHEVTAERFGPRPVEQPSRWAIGDVDAVLSHMITREDQLTPLEGAESIAVRAIVALSRAGAELRREAAKHTNRRPELAQRMLTLGGLQLDQARRFMADLVEQRRAAQRDLRDELHGAELEATDAATDE